MFFKKNKRKPIIGISCNIGKVDHGPFAGLDRVYINKAYVDWIVRAGGIPFMLPIVSDVEDIQAQVDAIDGLLLSGGQDVDPCYYDEIPHPLLEVIVPQRDKYEMGLLQAAKSQNKPILGICRGMQLINIAFGGTLYQDLSLQSESHRLNHYRGNHPIFLEPTSAFSALFPHSTFVSNSFHHQAVKELANGFEIVARANDGVVEAIAKTEGNWIVALQWHPEVDTDPLAARALFSAFIAQAATPPPQPLSHKNQMISQFLRRKTR